MGALSWRAPGRQCFFSWRWCRRVLTLLTAVLSTDQRRSMQMVALAGQPRAQLVSFALSQRMLAEMRQLLNAAKPTDQRRALMFALAGQPRAQKVSFALSQRMLAEMRHLLNAAKPTDQRRALMFALAGQPRAQKVSFALSQRML